MKSSIERPDSLIFDMDGTLWDNVNTYALAWIGALKELEYSVQVTRKSLTGWMGKEPLQLLNTLVPDLPTDKQDLFFDRIVTHYQQLISTMQPYIYPGVMEGLKQLHTKYKLLLSNCEESGLINFMDHTKTTHLFLDYMEYGQSNMPKSHNLKLLKERNNLKSPVYIGDTEGDSYETNLAGFPFVFMTYGFGKTENYHLKFDAFSELADYYMNM